MPGALTGVGDSLELGFWDLVVPHDAEPTACPTASAYPRKAAKPCNETPRTATVLVISASVLAISAAECLISGRDLAISATVLVISGTM